MNMPDEMADYIHEPGNCTVMGDLKLVPADVRYMEEYLEFIADCRDDIINTGFDSVIPLSSRETAKADIKRLCDIHAGKNLPANWVPASTYWLVDSANRIIGTVNIRHRLNERLEFRGGHISYYIRPSERNKGYGTRLLSLALNLCRSLGINKVLITCKKDNLPSKRVIEKNGGVLISEGADGADTIQRYMIYL